MQLGRNITYEYLVSQSLFYQVLNAVSQYISKKMFNGEMIFHLKSMQKRLSYYNWKSW